jgi:hypothetical protein
MRGHNLGCSLHEVVMVTLGADWWAALSLLFKPFFFSSTLHWVFSCLSLQRNA